MTDVLTVLSRERFYPVMGEEIPSNEVAGVRLGVDSPGADSYELGSFEGLEAYLEHVREEKDATILIGGYAEHRRLYQKAEQYNEPGTIREYHLGVDVWCRPGRSIYAPWDGIIVSSLFRPQDWDYGGLIILRHVWSDQMIHTLYGHVARESVDRYSAGDTVLAGDVIARVASKEESVGWVPHLHLQCVKDLFDYVDDFPGVVSGQELDRMLENCPNPQSILFDFNL